MKFKGSKSLLGRDYDLQLEDGSCTHTENVGCSFMMAHKGVTINYGRGQSWGDDRISAPLYRGYHKNVGVCYGGIIKSNLIGHHKIGIDETWSKNFHGYAA